MASSRLNGDYYIHQGLSRKVVWIALSRQVPELSAGAYITELLSLSWGKKGIIIVVLRYDLLNGAVC
jgi:hypothetical protein